VVLDDGLRRLRCAASCANRHAVAQPHAFAISLAHTGAQFGLGRRWLHYSTEQALGTSATARCGNFDTTKPGSPSLNWPADLAAGTSANRVDLSDVTSFLAPVRRLNTSPGKAGFDARWDLVPGEQMYADAINTLDLTALITLRPPMFGGAKAYGGPACQ